MKDHVRPLCKYSLCAPQQGVWESSGSRNLQKNNRWRFGSHCFDHGLASAKILQLRKQCRPGTRLASPSPSELPVQDGCVFIASQESLTVRPALSTPSDASLGSKARTGLRAGSMWAKFLFQPQPRRHRLIERARPPEATRPRALESQDPPGALVQPRVWL